MDVKTDLFPFYCNLCDILITANQLTPSVNCVKGCDQFHIIAHFIGKSFQLSINGHIDIFIPFCKII